MALLVAFIAAYLAPDGMRRIKQWDAEITADVLTNILQPGRFAQTTVSRYKYNFEAAATAEWRAAATVSFSPRGSGAPKINTGTEQKEKKFFGIF